MSTASDTLQAEAARAVDAVPALDDGLVAAALAEGASLLGLRRERILEVNAGDVEAASSTLDRGSLDRLTLTPARLEEMELQLRTMAELPPLERVIESWTTADGLAVSSLRIPVGVVGANFEARPNVALDVASQLLKSLNGGVLRTGSAAVGDRHRARRRGAATRPRERRAAARGGGPRALDRPRAVRKSCARCRGRSRSSSCAAAARRPRRSRASRRVTASR